MLQPLWKCWIWAFAYAARSLEVEVECWPVGGFGQGLRVVASWGELNLWIYEIARMSLCAMSGDQVTWTCRYSYPAGNWPIYRTRDCSCNQILLFLRSQQLHLWAETSQVSFFPFFLWRNDKSSIHHTCCGNRRSGGVFGSFKSAAMKKCNLVWAISSKRRDW